MKDNVAVGVFANSRLPTTHSNEHSPPFAKRHPLVAGERQTKKYWLRNRKMFANIEAAIDEADPDRVMIVVGLGHTYFLDALVHEAGYRWLDPRDYLPSR